MAKKIYDFGELAIVYTIGDQPLMQPIQRKVFPIKLKEDKEAVLEEVANEFIRIPDKQAGATGTATVVYYEHNATDKKKSLQMEVVSLSEKEMVKHGVFIPKS